MAVALAAVALLLLWRGRAAWLPVLGVAALFLVLGFTIPRLLAPVEWAWMKLAHYLGLVMTFVLVTLTFFLIITPVGLLMRLRKDTMNLKFKRKSDSYWIPVEKDGPTSRPEKPY